MRILAIYRHYWPDTTPYARILRLILEHLTAQGHQTAVYTAQPSYNDIRHARQPWRETRGGVKVVRVPLLPERKRFRLLRVINMAYFLLRAVAHATIGRRYDLVIANSHPPIAMGCALRLIRALTGTPFVFHCQDIHPESAVLAGALRPGPLYRLLRRSDSATCAAARHVVVLSQDMVDSLSARGLPTNNVVVVNNPPLPVNHSQESPLPKGFKNEPSVVRLLFAGNLGCFQGLERLVAAMRLLKGCVPAQLVFMGEGTAKRVLVEQASDLLDKQIVFVPHQPVETALAIIKTCDYGIVSLRSGVYRYAFPSKSMMYLSAGCPVVAVVEPESELARTIREYRLGYVAASQSVTDIAATIATAVAERFHWTPHRRQEIAGVCDRLYGQQRMLATWDQMVLPEPEIGRSHGLQRTGRVVDSAPAANERVSSKKVA